jgi:hypothetical protein
MAAFNFHRRKTRRWWYAGTTLVVAAFFAVFFVTSSAALNSSPSSFEAGDGNMVLDTSGHTDWNCFRNLTGFHSANLGPGAGVDTFIASDCGATTGATNNSSPDPDFEQKPGQKFDTACPTFQAGNNPPKDVWSDVAQYLESASNGDVFFYGAAIRPVVNGNSSGNIYFSQGTGCRTKGDVLLTFDFLNGGGTKPVLHILTWQVGSGSCFVGSDSTTTGCWGPSSPPTITGDNSDGETNGSQINAADNGLNGQNVLTNGFSEIGVNLTQAIKAAGGTTTCFANETWVSRSSGSSFTSTPEMVVQESQPTCGSITVIKHTLDGAGNETGIDQAFSYGTTGALTPSTFSLNDSGASYSISSISAANPAVVTTSAANTITSGQIVTISGSNSTPSANGSWVATKISSTKFSIPLTVTTAGTAAGTVSVSNTQTYSNLPPGTYSVTEGTEPANFAFVSLTCKNNGTTDNTVVGGQTATIGLAPQDSWVCTYVNQQQLGAIRINKTSSKGTALSGARFYLCTNDVSSTSTCTAATNASGSSVTNPLTATDSNGTVCVPNLPFGQYYVFESAAPSGYKIDSTANQSANVQTAGDCSSSTSASNTLGFTDTPLTTLDVSVTSVAAGATHSNIVCADSSNNALTAQSPNAENGQADTFHISAISTGTTTSTLTLSTSLGVSTGTLRVGVSGSNSTPGINGNYTATVTNATTLTIPLSAPVTVAGTSGTLTVFDDTHETFGNGTTSLTPGTYTCTVIIDP